MTEGVKIAFERRVISVAVGRLLPTRALPPGLHETRQVSTYRRLGVRSRVDRAIVRRASEGRSLSATGWARPTRCLARPRGCRSALHHRQ